MNKIFSVLIVLSLLFVYGQSESKDGFGRAGSFKGYKSLKYKNPAVKKEKKDFYRKNQYQKRYDTKNKPFFMSPIFKWIIGGMIFGAILSLLFGYGFHIGMPGLLEILLIGGIVYYFYKKSKKSSSEKVKQEEKSDINHIQKDEIDEDFLKNFVKNLFLKLQEEWSKGEISPLKKFLTDKMYNHLEMQLIDLTERKVKNIIEVVDVKYVDIIHIENLEDKKLAIAEIEAKMLDYTVDEYGRVIKGNKERPVIKKEYWTLIGKGLNWKIKNINKVEE